MKLSVSNDEHDLLDALDDESLVKLVRDSLAARRASGASDDLEQADPSSASHGGKSVPTLEAVGSRNANQSANDAAIRAAHRRAALDSNLTPEQRASHRHAAEYDPARERANEKLIPGLGRL
jgi:hypothetical protein